MKPKLVLEDLRYRNAVIEADRPFKVLKAKRTDSYTVGSYLSEADLQELHKYDIKFVVAKKVATDTGPR